MKQSNDPTFLSADTPVSHSATQENDKEKKMHAIYGPSVSEPYAFFDPDTHCLRMCEGILVSGFPKFSQTLPASGSMQNGKLFQQLRLVHHTKGTGYSLWRTPTANDAKQGNGPSQLKRDSLTGQVLRMNWPTPTVDDSNNVTRKSGAFQSLTRKVMEAETMKWPTPQANSWGATGHRNQLQKQVDNGTITAEEKAAMSSGNGGKLNPTWVEWLMGFPLGWTDLEHSETL